MSLLTIEGILLELKHFLEECLQKPGEQLWTLILRINDHGKTLVILDC